MRRMRPSLEDESDEGDVKEGEVNERSDATTRTCWTS